MAESQRAERSQVVRLHALGFEGRHGERLGTRGIAARGESFAAGEKGFQARWGGRSGSGEEE
ncbi:MAG: hypothetical protein FJ034_08115 [Chloroflexi bacterium]|nr:hypothetical protein [Chloroflexota bacterium]